MAVNIKLKNLGWLEANGVPSALVTQLKALGATMSRGHYLLTIYIGNKKWVLPSKGGNHWIPNDVSDFCAKVVAEAKAKPVYVGMDYATPTAEVIPLRDATALYQRVKGTSNGSVYVLVGIAESAGVKIAAKINGLNLSVRAEGDGIGGAGGAALAKQGMQNKGKYMSGHYECNVDAPPSKVLGAVLFGSGLKFSTPMPDTDKVAKEGA